MLDTAVVEQVGEPAARKVEFLSKRLAFHIADFKKKRNQSRVYAGLIKVMVILFGGVTTIILGAKGYPYFKDYQVQLDIMALVHSTSGSMLIGIEALSSNTWRWIKYRRTPYDLYTIQDDFLYSHVCASAVPDDKIDDLYKPESYPHFTWLRRWSGRVRS